MKITVEFGQDGTETLIYTAPNRPSFNSVNVTGSYTVNGNSLTQRYTSLKIGSTSLALTADQAKPKIGTFTLDGDQLTVTDSASHKALTLARVKTE